MSVTSVRFPITTSLASVPNNIKRRAKKNARRKVARRRVREGRDCQEESFLIKLGMELKRLASEKKDSEGQTVEGESTEVTGEVTEVTGEVTDSSK